MGLEQPYSKDHHMTLHTTRSERKAHSLALRAHKAKLPQRIRNTDRERIEQSIEAHLAEVDALILTLDQCDGEADFEAVNEDGGNITDEPHDPEANEPSLSWGADINQARALSNCAGALHFRRGGWQSRDEDLEAEHDGREPDSEDEGAQCEDEGAEDYLEGDEREDWEPRVAAFVLDQGGTP